MPRKPDFNAAALAALADLGVSQFDLGGARLTTTIDGATRFVFWLRDGSARDGLFVDLDRRARPTVVCIDGRNLHRLRATRMTVRAAGGRVMGAISLPAA